MSTEPTPLDRVYEEHSDDLRTTALEESVSHFHPSDHATLLVDGPNFYGTFRTQGYDVDYSKLFDWFRTLCNMQAIYYFSAVSTDQHHAHLVSVLSWMRDHGVRVRTTDSTKDLSLGQDGQWRGNMDVDIAVVALTECSTSNHIILATGDGDFVPVVRKLQQMGKKVTILSSKRGEPCFLSTELRKEADGFIELTSLECATRRTPAPPRRKV